MDPFTVIVSALQAATAAADSQVVQDAYNGFKALLKRKFGSNPRLDRTLEDFNEKPAVYEAPMKDVLQETGAQHDQEVVDAAVKLLKQAEEQKPGVSGGLVGQINAQGGQVNVVGGNVYGDISFSPSSPTRPTT